METKILEVRDHGTFIPVVCIRMNTEGYGDGYLLSRAGFHKDTHLVQLVWLSSGRSEYDPYKWNDRTMYNAHGFITTHWDSLKNGDVVDVAYILGETKELKQSERYDH
jgi:hypothetical protein